MNSFENFTVNNEEQLAKNKKKRDKERKEKEKKKIVDSTNEAIVSMPEVKVMLNSAAKGITVSKREKSEADWKHRTETNELREDAETDPLTGLNNRRGFEKYIAKKKKSIQREETAFARLGKEMTSERREKLFNIFIVDLDKFKNVNDTYGHDAGDKALIEVSHAMQEELRRSNDMVARWGGEEFIVVVQDDDNNKATEVADRLRQTVEDLSIEYNGEKVPVTVSIGVAPYLEDVRDMYKVADQALYVAKGNNEKIQKEGLRINGETLTEETSRNQVWYLDKDSGEYTKYK